MLGLQPGAVKSRQEGPATSCEVGRGPQNRWRRPPLQSPQAETKARALSNNPFNKIKFLIAHLIH